MSAKTELLGTLNEIHRTHIGALRMLVLTVIPTHELEMVVEVRGGGPER